MILALDVATVTGWAAGNRLSNQPSVGVINLKDGRGIGGKLGLLTRQLSEIVEQYEPEMVIFEQPWLGSGQRSSQTMRLALSLCAGVELVASWYDVKCLEVPIPTWRKHFIGAGRKPKGESSNWCKVQAQHRCKVLGWGDLTSDQAEACGIWDYAMSLKR